MLHARLPSDTFERLFEVYKERLVDSAALARCEGILALERQLNEKAIQMKDPLEVGLKLIIDGCEREFVTQVLDNMEFADSPPDCVYTKILYQVARQGCLALQDGSNPRIVEIIVNSLYPVELIDKSESKWELYRDINVNPYPTYGHPPEVEYPIYPFKRKEKKNEE